MHVYFLQRKCSPKNLVFSDISFMVIFEEVTENECIIDSHLRDIDVLSDSVTHVHYVVVVPDLTDGAAVLLLHG